MATISPLQGFKNTPDVTHGFFTRHGGVSAGIYAGLNCGTGSNDNPDHVRQNRALVADALGAAPENLISLYQCHSADCLYVDKPWSADSRPQADAFVTDVPGLALGILTADCAPVLFTGAKADGSPVIGAAHAGWKGAIGGVLSATAAKMKEIGAQPETIRAAIGPCIAQRSYEVDEAFAKRFFQQQDENEKFFASARREGHYMFDLEGYCALRLAQEEISDIYACGADTYAREGEFYSFRRTTHRGEPDYGRQISAIMIRKES